MDIRYMDIYVIIYYIIYMDNCMYCLWLFMYVCVCLKSGKLELQVLVKEAAIEK
jgi:hypothetical protein